MTQPKGAAQTAEEWITKAVDELSTTLGELDWDDSLKVEAQHIIEKAYAASRFSQSERVQAASTSFEQWRKEFPCGVIHGGYPGGTTCLDCRDFAIKNAPPHRFVEEFRQQYINWNRNLFCDNCWSCHLLFGERGASAVPSPALEKCPQCGSDDRRVNATPEYNCLHTWHKQGVPSPAGHWGCYHSVPTPGCLTCSVPSPAATPLCLNEFQLRYGFYCQLPKGHLGDHEAECANPQFHQRWPTEAAQPSEAVQEWINEDELPEGYPYDKMFQLSKLGHDGRGGVRIFPKVEAVSDNELIALADEIERTAFFREIDVMETDISALKHAIANLVRSKVFKREAVSSTAAPPLVMAFGDWCEMRGVRPTMGMVENYASDMVRRSRQPSPFATAAPEEKK